MKAASGEARFQNVENSGFKRKGRLDNAVHFVQHMSPDLNI